MPAQRDPATEAARAYERLHVDALFRVWADPVLDAARVGPGESVLDVACGTGVLARAAYDRVGPHGTVVGSDIDPGMLSVAASIEPAIRWVRAEAGRQPLEDDSCDAVVSQFGMMFFPDPVQAVREMVRCTRAGGLVVVAVWDDLERSPVYPACVDLLQRRAGTAAADALRAPFVLGDVTRLQGLFEAAGAAPVSITSERRPAVFPSVRSMVEADLRGWLPVLGVHLDADLVEDLLVEAEDLLREHVAPDGRMVFDAPAHVVVVRS